MSKRTALLIFNIALRCFACPAADVEKDFGGPGSVDLNHHDFAELHLNGANFSDVGLKGANFSKASLKNANFSKARLENANFKGADITSAIFTDADLTGADLRETTTKGSHCEGANFSKANLEGLSFALGFGCKYNGANLRMCKISGRGDTRQDFCRADLRGANMRAVTTLATALLKGAIYNEDTAFPDGYDPAAAGMVLAKPEPKKDNRVDTVDKK
jgi:uncharacterized protein YjbI with pentapeptide repeats